MSSLSFPDLNVWLALTTPEHVHHASATRWWDQEKNNIAFMRFTQMGFLRLMTTASAMDGRPLTMAQAWRVYDRLFEDDRVIFVPEPATADARFREIATRGTAAPKVWGDAWLRAFAESADGIVVTFDRALAVRSNALLLR